MNITGIETVPLRIPFKAGTKSDASAWGDGIATLFRIEGAQAGRTGDGGQTIVEAALAVPR